MFKTKIQIEINGMVIFNHATTRQLTKRQIREITIEGLIGVDQSKATVIVETTE